MAPPAVRLKSIPVLKIYTRIIALQEEPGFVDSPGPVWRAFSRFLFNLPSFFHEI